MPATSLARNITSTCLLLKRRLVAITSTERERIGCAFSTYKLIAAWHEAGETDI
ncbi:hypothetical protein J2W91_001105 [Paenibacillus amylolyticus]|uniref:Uncharacterized protein n=1 Tax=Paenibacillus amylolyticus TaxID=1451 RepID=A0AAP5GYU1_PAEAM|nr:hypothetical protein [Paenibacillus amylolyticus]